MQRHHHPPPRQLQSQQHGNGHYHPHGNSSNNNHKQQRRRRKHLHNHEHPAPFPCHCTTTISSSSPSSLLYPLLGLTFVSMQVTLLFWGYHVSQIPTTSIHHDIRNLQQQQQQQNQWSLSEKNVNDNRNSQEQDEIDMKQNDYDNEEEDGGISNNEKPKRPKPNPDGYFNGFPIYYHDLTLDPNFHTRPYTQIHCVGENYQHQSSRQSSGSSGGTRRDLNKNTDEDNEEEEEEIMEETSWMKKSCHYRFICLNMTSHELEVYPRPIDAEFEEFVRTSEEQTRIRLQQQQRQQRQQQQNFYNSHSGLTTTTTSSQIIDVTSSVMMSKIHDAYMMNSVSLGSIVDTTSATSATNSNGADGFRWIPSSWNSIDHPDRPLQLRSPPDKFYTLDDGVVLVPFFSMYGWDVKSLVWDDFLAIYTLLHMFQFHDNKNNNSNNVTGAMDINSTTTTTNQKTFRPLLMRYVSPKDIPFENSCDSNQARYEECQSTIEKYQSLMMPMTMTSTTNTNDQQQQQQQQLLTTQQDFVFQTVDSTSSNSNNDHRIGDSPTSPGSSHPKTDLICAKDGVAGLGSLTDHGTMMMTMNRFGSNPGPNGSKRHNGNHYHHNRQRSIYLNSKFDPKPSHNHGRGGVLWRFRKYCLNNLGLSTSSSLSSNNNHHKILISESVLNDLTWFDLHINKIHNRNGNNSEKDVKNNKDMIIDFLFSRKTEDDVLPKKKTTKTSTKKDETESRHLAADSTTSTTAAATTMYDIVSFVDMDIKRSVETVLDATAFIVHCESSDSIMSMFLPKGSTIVFYCPVDDDVDDDHDDSDNDNSRSHGTSLQQLPTYRQVHQDLFNHMSYLHVHWIPTSSTTNSKTQFKTKSNSKSSADHHHHHNHPSSSSSSTIHLLREIIQKAISISTSSTTTSTTGMSS